MLRINKIVEGVPVQITYDNLIPEEGVRNTYTVKSRNVPSTSFNDAWDEIRRAMFIIIGVDINTCGIQLKHVEFKRDTFAEQFNYKVSVSGKVLNEAPRTDYEFKTSFRHAYWPDRDLDEKDDAYKPKKNSMSPELSEHFNKILKEAEEYLKGKHLQTNLFPKNDISDGCLSEDESLGDLEAELE